MEDGAGAKLQECLLLGQDTEDSRFKLVNDRLRVLMADAHDILTADIMYQVLFFLFDPNQKKNDIVKKKLRS